MAVWRTFAPSRLNSISRTHGERKRTRHRNRLANRNLRLEPFEERALFAIGPQLIAVIPNEGDLITGSSVLHVAPRELTFRFDDGQVIDAQTIAKGIEITRSNGDDVFFTNDITVTTGFAGLGENQNEVVLRFNTTLPDDLYQIKILGAGANALKNDEGDAFNNGVDVIRTFELDLGAKVLSVVPQPIFRDSSGKLSQALDQVDVYFNDDNLNVNSAKTASFYELIRTNGTATNADDTIFNPVSVTYDAVADKAVLKFNQAQLNTPGTYRLRIGNNNPLPLAPTPTLTIDDEPFKVLETNAGTTNAVFTVRLSAPSAQTVKVNFATANDTALSGSDYVSNSGTLTFLPGVTTQTITVAVNGDTLDEANEKFSVNLATPVNALLAISKGTGAIIDDDGTIDNNVFGDPGSSFSAPNSLGNLFAGQGMQSLLIASSIDPQDYLVTFPGASNEAGHRDIAQESHLDLLAVADKVGGVTVIPYNFKSDYGKDPFGNELFNLITEAQKQRAREIFEVYSHYAGVQFVETERDGFTIATGDIRAVNSQAQGGPGGIAAISDPVTLTLVLDNAEDWGNGEPGGQWFTTAMQGVGFLLGLGKAYDLAPLTIMALPGFGESIGNAEEVFPGDHDIVHLQHLYRPDVKDIDLYKFTLSQKGQLSLETVAERLGDSSLLNSVITLYDSNRQIIARNDDYFSKDSFLQLALEAGDYYVAVTSTGNTSFDPTVADSGMGGRTQGEYQLRLNFLPTAAAGLVDTTGALLDGDDDGKAGGTFNFWFRVQDSAHTIFVDKATAGGSGAIGSITNPYVNVSTALAASQAGDIVRIVGNGGNDQNLATLNDNQTYNIGFDVLGRALSDGSKMEIPKGVTVMVDAGAIFKFRGANIDVGSSAQGIDRSGGALQVLGTTQRDPNGADIGTVYFTSYHNEALGRDLDPRATTPAKGDWGGLVFREDSDLETQGIFLSSVNRADISYGGGNVVVNSVPQVFNPIHMLEARPTISNNVITNSADAAMSGDPNAFEESEFQSDTYTADYRRIGPHIHGNLLLNNSINGIFVGIKTQAGSALEPLTVSARFDDTDIVHVVAENLVIAGDPGGPVLDPVFGNREARLDAQLAIDAGVIVKLDGARIETQMGGQLLAEGTAQNRIVFTSLMDDRYGAGGTFDTTGNGTPVATVPGEIVPGAAAPGDWAGLYFGRLSSGSLDQALVTYAGGAATVEGKFANFDAIEIHQADVRIVGSTIEKNDGSISDESDDRNGRGSASNAAIFVRGAQPVLLDNIIRDNDAPAISINVNALNSQLVDDRGRSTGAIGLHGEFFTNFGALVHGNRLGNNKTNGMVVREGTLTTQSVWDDTDIVHVVLGDMIVPNFHAYGGLRLQSSGTESLVVKFSGDTAGLTASGTALDIDDRIGGSVHIVGTPGHPVVLTSLFDGTVGAGLTPDGRSQTDTNNDGFPGEIIVGNSGAIFIDGGDREEHGSFNATTGENEVGWKLIEQAVNFAYTSSLNTAGTGVLVIGAQSIGTNTFGSLAAVTSVTTVLNLPMTVVRGSAISTVKFEDFRMIFVPSDSSQTSGGITDADLQLLAGRKFDVQRYVNIAGGSLVAFTERTSPFGYDWLELPAPFQIADPMSFTGILKQTPALAAAGFNITDQELSNGTPWHNSFTGPPGFNGLEPWVLSDKDEVVTLGGKAGGSGIGGASTGSPGDWRSIKIDSYSNDRNVEIINELEQGFVSGADTNSLPTLAQQVGMLAGEEKSGDDNLRLGFEIHGSLSRASDVDVYSFKAKAGTEVWLDIDRTSQALDSVVELVDANGSVVARSDNSDAELQTPGQLIGLARVMKRGDFSIGDVYTTNSRDAGLRVVLPGIVGVTSTYYVRVRSSSPDLINLTGGQTKGVYQLQVRLRELDELPGSTVRYADIRNATNGIEVFGKPGQSPLMGEAAEQITTTNDTVSTAEQVGNLLGSNRGALSVGGSLETPADVDWYKFTVQYDLIQGIGALGPRSISAIFDIDYADGMGRPDTTISVFDQDGNLLLTGRDSDISDDQPRPNTGSDTTDLSRGSFGKLDAYVGNVQLPEGTNRTYYVAVSSNTQLPSILDATFEASPNNPLVRLEPVTSVTRLAEDHIGTVGGSTANTPVPLFPGNSTVDLNKAANVFKLSDVATYFISSTDLFTSDPFTGKFISDVTGAKLFLPNTTGPDAIRYGDLVVRGDGKLFSLTLGQKDADSGNYQGISPANGSGLDVTDDGILTFELDPVTPFDPTTGKPNFVAQDVGVDFNAMTSVYTGSEKQPYIVYAVGNRDPGNLIDGIHNLLFVLDGTTGIPINVPDKFAPSLLTGTNPSSFGVLDFSDTNAFLKVAAATGATAADDLLDGQTVTIDSTGARTLTFEFDSGPEITLVDQTLIDNLRDGKRFTVTGPTGPAKIFEFDSGPVLTVGNGASFTDGDTLSLTDVNGKVLNLEFDSNNVLVNPLFRRVTFAPGDSAHTILLTLDATIDSAAPLIRGSFDADNPNTVRLSLTGDAAIAFTSTGLSTDGAYGALGGATPVPFEETFTTEQLGASIADAVNAGFGNTLLLVADSARDRVTFQGATLVADIDSSAFTPGGGISGVTSGNVQVKFGAGDSAFTVARALAQQINNFNNVDSPQESPRDNAPNSLSDFTTIAIQSGGTITLENFTSVDDSNSLPAIEFVEATTNAAGDITGIALLNNTMFAVDTLGHFYRVNGHNSSSANLTRLTTSGPILNPTSNQAIRFSGLTTGPLNANDGAYANTLFATDSSGNLYALDTMGALLPIFENGEKSVDVGVSDLQGIAFSPIDYNLWHVTRAREDDPGHQINGSFDFDDAPGERLNIGANLSFYFGLEDPELDTTISQADQPGSEQFKHQNAGVYGTYDLPGGAAHGSLSTAQFSLEGYAATDKPTLYFDYFLETEEAESYSDGATQNFMRDSFRVFASENGTTWTQLATNNSFLTTPTANKIGELPKYLSSSGGLYRGDKDIGGLASQRIQELFDNTGGWRQARVDLGDLAGKSNVRLRFDFATAGSMREGLASDLLGLTDGDTKSNQRGQNNNFEGVYLDNVIVGFAERGEMVTGHFTPTFDPLDPHPDPPAFPGGVTDFFTVPPNPAPGAPAQTLTGAYQLEIRRGTSYAVATSDFFPSIALTADYDTNERFTNSWSILAPAGAAINDGDTFRISDGLNTATFEFDTNNSVASGSIKVAFTGADSAAVIAQKMRDAVNANTVAKVKASTIIGGNKLQLFNAEHVELNFAGTAIINNDVLRGDGNIVRDQGQTLLQSNTITRSLEFGVLVDAGANAQAVRNLRELNTTGLVPGVSITNNVISEGGFGGIKFSGVDKPLLFLAPSSSQIKDGQLVRITDAATTVTFEFDFNGAVNDTSVPVTMKGGETSTEVADLLEMAINFSTLGVNAFANGSTLELTGVVALTGLALTTGGNTPVPFSRVVNNTIYGSTVAAGTGILVEQNSSPTILNNIIANTKTGVQIDFSSNSAVLGANVYQGNTTNRVGGGTETRAIILTPEDLLFIAGDKGNFYLAEGSQAIDSSLDSLQDRPALTAVSAPLGITVSPILAPERDVLGQLRVDDPAVPPPPGLGFNVFKDRGALDRADFVGPTAQLVSPLDNDSAGKDHNPSLNQVQLIAQTTSEFAVQLVDTSGAGIDDDSVILENFTLKRGSLTLALTTDYLYSYDETNNVVRFIAAAGIWTPGTYTLTLSNTDGTLQDLAGNDLLPNDVSGETQFIIALSANPISPWQNAGSGGAMDVNNSGFVSSLDALVVINGLNNGLSGPLPVPATPPPYYDVNGDGALTPLDALIIINHLNNPQSPAMAAATGVSDASSAQPAMASATSSDQAAPAPDAPSASPRSTAPDATPGQLAFALATDKAISKLAGDSPITVSGTSLDAVPLAAKLVAIDDELPSEMDAARPLFDPHQWYSDECELDAVLSEIAGDLHGVLSGADDSESFGELS